MANDSRRKYLTGIDAAMGEYLEQMSVPGERSMQARCCIARSFVTDFLVYF